MAETDLLDRLTGAGLIVAVDAGRLIVRPRDRLTDELRQRIHAERSALISRLSSTPPSNRGLGYTVADLQEFDRLIEVYVARFSDARQRSRKRVELLTARWRMPPAKVQVELAEFRALVNEAPSSAPGQSPQYEEQAAASDISRIAASQPPSKGS